MAGIPGRGGVKGRSGRKSTTDEAKRLRVIEKSWEIIEQSLNDPNLDMDKKREIAMSIVLKSIPQQFEGKSELKVTVQHEDIEERLAWFQKPSVN